MSSSEASAAPDPITRILGYLVAIAAILGIPGGLYGFFSAEHAKRVEKTFEFYSEFRGEAFQKNWSYLIGKWNAQADEVKKLTDANDQEGIRKLASAIAMDEAGRKSFEEVLGFFDGLAACVETSLCDGNSAAALLRLPASDFASAFGPHIIFAVRCLETRSTVPACFKHEHWNVAGRYFKIRCAEKSDDPFCKSKERFFAPP